MAHLSNNSRRHGACSKNQQRSVVNQLSKLSKRPDSVRWAALSKLVECSVNLNSKQLDLEPLDKNLYSEAKHKPLELQDLAKLELSPHLDKRQQECLVNKLHSLLYLEVSNSKLNSANSQLSPYLEDNNSSRHLSLELNLLVRQLVKPLNLCSEAISNKLLVLHSLVHNQLELEVFLVVSKQE